MNKAEKEEKKYLEKVNIKIEQKLLDLENRIKKYREDIKQDTIFRGEARSDMDHAEKINFRQSIEEKVMVTDRAIKQKNKLKKTKEVPYFGRLDFVEENKQEAEKIYLGINNFYDDKSSRPVIYDWRSPISSLFYNFELGKAYYQAPEKSISGDVTLKRQFKIRNAQMEYMIESGVSIMDDVLQKELSQNSDEKMKNIVATIERDQNQIIRNEKDEILIIQGVAGSGKTSIALHRIAFLLYRFKEKLKAEDILIISPNRVFSDYISNVLPELGEEPVAEIQMESLAEEILKSDFKFKSSYQQNLKILAEDDDSLIERVKYKASFEFVEKLDQYIENIKSNLFLSKYVRVADCLVPDWLFDEAYEKFKDYSRKDCIKKILEFILIKIKNEYDYKFDKDEVLRLKNHVEKMHKGKDLLSQYKNFFKFIDKEDLFKLEKNSYLEYNDVYPLIYLKIKLGSKSISAKNVKHLIVDEMQDYSFIQYLVINKIFKAKKTILGDINQAINPYNNIDQKNLSKIFTSASLVELNKSYRSSYEIMEFVNKIIENKKLETIKRHGEKPQIFKYESNQEEKKAIIEILKTKTKNNLAVIFKIQEEADDFYQLITEENISANLLSETSLNFKQGIIVCCAYMAKGLEFDEVIVVGVSEKNYKTIIDRKLLYVACTRAMHKLKLTYTNNLSKLIG